MTFELEAKERRFEEDENYIIYYYCSVVIEGKEKAASFGENFVAGPFILCRGNFLL
jgi:hypothetical protein